MHTANSAGRENAKDTLHANNDQHKTNKAAVVANVTDKGEQSIIPIGIGIIYPSRYPYLNSRSDLITKQSDLNWGGVEAGVADVPDEGADAALEVGHGAARAATGAAHPLDVVPSRAIGAGPQLGHVGSLELRKKVFRQPNRARASARLIPSAAQDEGEAEPNRTQPWIGLRGRTTAPQIRSQLNWERKGGGGRFGLDREQSQAPRAIRASNRGGGYRREKEEIVASAGGWISTPRQSSCSTTRPTGRGR